MCIKLKIEFQPGSETNVSDHVNNYIVRSYRVVIVITNILESSIWRDLITLPNLLSTSHNRFSVKIKPGQCYNNSRISKDNICLGCLINLLCYEGFLTSQNVIGIEGSLHVQNTSSKQQWSEYL